MRNSQVTYLDVDWKQCRNTVFRLQQQIAAAYKLGDYERVRELQEQLVRSFAGRALAVRKVVMNKGGQTPGVDKVLWKTTESRTSAIYDLFSLSKYIAKPVRRVYIPKKNGKLRPLGIPTLFDRAVQALYAMAFIPIAEQMEEEIHAAMDIVHIVQFKMWQFTLSWFWGL